MRIIQLVLVKLFFAHGGEDAVHYEKVRYSLKLQKGFSKFSKSTKRL